MADLELKKLEKKIFLQYFEDGLWDIYIGLLLISFGLTITFNMGYLAGIFGSLGILITKQAKTVFAYPRIGYIQFKQRRKRNISLILFGVLILGIVFFFFIRGGQNNAITIFLKANMLLVIASIWGGALALAGYFLDVNRFILFGASVFIFVFAGDWIGSLGANLIFIGTLIVLVGVYTLYKFTKQYPIIEAKEK